MYYQNSGQEKQLKKLYESTKKAIMSWDGQFDSDSVCIDDSNESFWVTEQLMLQPSIFKPKSVNEEEIQRFSTNIRIRLKKKDGTLRIQLKQFYNLIVSFRVIVIIVFRSIFVWTGKRQA